MASYQRISVTRDKWVAPLSSSPAHTRRHGGGDGGRGDDDRGILAAYPDLEREDIAEALRYAAEAVRERELPLRTVA